MAGFFELERFSGPSAARRPYGAEVAREWLLPALRCDICKSVYAWNSLQFPNLDLKGFRREQDLRVARGVGPEVFWPLCKELEAWLGGSVKLLPGMEFGRLSGSIKGRPPELAWVDVDGGILFSRTTAQLWERETRLNLPRCVETAVRSESDPGARILEWDIPLWGRLSDSVKVTKSDLPCPGCGIQSPDRVRDIVLEAGSVNGAPDVFRVSDRPNVVVGTQRLIDMLAALNLAGIEGHALEVR